jgi:pSer/pThr/pTyr-binding forkhead associated (FHA) protein
VEHPLVGPQLRDPMPALAGLSAETSASSLGPLLAVLIMRRGRPGGGHFTVRQPLLRIGRDPKNELVLDVPSVSAAHAELRLRGGVWTLTDVGSMNGSWVDGEPVYGSAPLGPGSAIRLGDVELVFSPKDVWDDSPREGRLEAAPLEATPIEAPTVESVVAPRARFLDDPPSFVLPEPSRRPGPLLFIAVALAVAALAYFLRQVS